jgi:hypothetical protein
MRGKLFLLLTCGILFVQTGCSLVLPTISNEPVIRNPFPQLSRVAVAPFFNQSDEPTLDGRLVAAAYFAELQKTPGFEVVPVNVVEEAMIAHRVDLGGPGEARRLAQILGVDAVIVGAVTDYSPYYPPRIGMRVEWYTANPGYHEIPAGYGLPWRTPDEEFIPDSLVYESQLAVARSQMAGLAPACDQMIQPLPAPPQQSPQRITPPQNESNTDVPQTYELESEENVTEEELEETNAGVWNELRLVQATEELPVAVPTPATEGAGNVSSDVNSGPCLTTDSLGTINAFPLTWEGGSCFAPPLSQDQQPACLPHNGPVLVHTRIYRGTDRELTEALKGYVYHRDDARFGGWEAYLQRSDDFIRFCCHMHISEMLSARGGARKTRVLWAWPESR